VNLQEKKPEKEKEKARARARERRKRWYVYPQIVPQSAYG
jgi:hypothetical protein